MNGIKIMNPCVQTLQKVRPYKRMRRTYIRETTPNQTQYWHQGAPLMCINK